MTCALPLLGPLPLLGLLAACSAPPDDASSYVAEVQAARAAKERAFQDASDSPVPPDRKPELLPLGYFPIDPEYRVPAVLKPAPDNQVVEMPTSTGQRRQMRRAGFLEFSLKGRALKLTAFVEANAPNADRLFVPFADMTSGTETYAAGRYLDLDRTATAIYVLDFNRAYHPYCYYDERFDCPYPPAENRLPVPVRAGERMRKR